MSMEFNLKNGEIFRTVQANKDSATVLPYGCLVALDSGGLIIKAVAASTAVAWCPNGGTAGETTVDVTIGDNFSLKGTGAANFAVTQKGTTCDISGTTTVVIANTTSSTNVLQIGIAEDSGTVGSTAGIEVRIAKPLF